MPTAIVHFLYSAPQYEFFDQPAPSKENEVFVTVDRQE